MTTIKKPYKVKKDCHTDQTEGEIGGGGASVDEADGRWLKGEHNQISVQWKWPLGQQISTIGYQSGGSVVYRHDYDHPNAVSMMGRSWDKQVYWLLCWVRRHVIMGGGGGGGLKRNHS